MTLLEKITRSNIYLYLLSKYLYQNYLYIFFYEKEFRILKFIKNNNGYYQTSIPIRPRAGTSCFGFCAKKNVGA